MKTFREFIEDTSAECFFTFGRFQPPHAGHGKMISEMKTVAGDSSYRVYVSPTSEGLSHTDRVKWLRKVAPDHGRRISEIGHKDVLHVAAQLFSEGFDRITLCCGSDRAQELHRLLNKYNGVRQANGVFYNFFSEIRVHSTHRTDSDPSSTRLRELVTENNFPGFAKLLPEGMKDSHRYFTQLRKLAGLKPERAILHK